jgi:hypothetical protein
MKYGSILRRVRDSLLGPILAKPHVVEKSQHQENDLAATFINEHRGGNLDYEELIKKYVTAMIEQRWKIIDSFDKIRFNNYEFSCQICNGKINTSTAMQYRTECIFKGGSLIRFECPSCGCIIGPLKMLELDKATFDLDYFQHYSVFSEGDTTEDEKFTFYQMEPQKNKRYLNYGCGAWSNSMNELRAEGYDVYGYEPYTNKYGNPYIIASLNELDKLQFDGIFSNNVIECVFRTKVYHPSGANCTGVPGGNCTTLLEQSVPVEKVKK